MYIGIKGVFLSIVYICISAYAGVVFLKEIVSTVYVQ
jgi:hypothetical protein